MDRHVGAQHEFHDAAFVQDWADRFVPTAPRLALFDLILEQISKPGLPRKHGLELGLGPGYMARHLLERNAAISYEGLDFSTVFFEIAKKTIGGFMPRVTLTSADLMDRNWPEKLSQRPGAIISTWALHDLGSQEAVARVYARCFETLPKGGMLVNGDLIKPEGATWTYEPGRFEMRPLVLADGRSSTPIDSRSDFSLSYTNRRRLHAEAAGLSTNGESGGNGGCITDQHHS